LASGLPEELFVRAFLHDLALMKNEDPVSINDRRHSMGNDDRGALLHQSLKGFMDEPFGRGIQIRCGFVEY
jgi:hypothetical protein